MTADPACLLIIAGAFIGGFLLGGLALFLYAAAKMPRWDP